jgi:hypothetical protein
MKTHDHNDEAFPGPEDHAAAARHLREMHDQDRQSDWDTLAEEHAALHSIEDAMRGRSDGH